MSTLNTTNGFSMYNRAKRIIPGGTQLLSKRPELFLPDIWPSYYIKAKGCEVWDTDGNHFYDMTTCGIGACLLGFADEDVNMAVKQAIDSGNMCTLNVPAEVELAELLCAIHPWAEKVRYARTGGESMVIAVRIARAYTNRDKIAFCGYHGWHDWYLAANLSDVCGLDGHLLPGLEPTGVPKALKNTALPFHYNRVDELHEIFEKNPGEIAAVVMEPLRHNLPEDNFLATVRDLTNKNGAVLVFDEITSGWRFHTGGIHIKLGVEPDIAVFAKAMSNGFPMAAVIGKADVMEAAQNSFISSTYWTEAVGPAAALAAIKKMQSLNLPEKVRITGERIQEGWRSAADEVRLNIKLKGLPALCGFVFDYPQKQILKTIFTYEMLQRGFLASINVYPTFAHTHDIIDEYLDAVKEVFEIIKNVLDTDSVYRKYAHLKEAHKGFVRLT